MVIFQVMVKEWNGIIFNSNVSNHNHGNNSYVNIYLLFVYLFNFFFNETFSIQPILCHSNYCI